MKRTKTIRVVIDFALTILLPVLMGYALTGQKFHEYAGTVFSLLFIIHTLLNRKWYTSLFQGRYTLSRTAKTIINLLLLAAVLGLMVSGVAMSGYVFDFLPFDTGMSFARNLHMLSSYWGFVFSCLHLGFHWTTVVSNIQKRFPKPSKSGGFIAKSSVGVVSLLGAYAFWNNKLFESMFFILEFPFFDLEKNILIHLLEYGAMMVLFSAVGYYGIGELNRIKLLK